MNSVIVRVQKGPNLITPKFRQCLVHLCREDVKSVKIRLKLINDSLIISCDNAFLETDLHLLQHSIVCPFQELDGYKKLAKEESNIPVAVSVVLESSDGHILLTRRSSHMRSSPNVWVPPGGHLDRGESLIECGLRELYEETGISFNSSEITFKILCLWENVFPIMLGFGEPKTHALVVYYHVKCQKNHKELSHSMNINPEEVEAYAWLPAQAIAAIFGTRGKAHPGTQFTWNRGEITETSLDYLKMFNRGIWLGGEMYSGVQASLSTWLQQHQALMTKL